MFTLSIRYCWQIALLRLKLTIRFNVGRDLVCKLFGIYLFAGLAGWPPNTKVPQRNFAGAYGKLLAASLRNIV
jgi:hypothetical protein